MSKRASYEELAEMPGSSRRPSRPKTALALRARGSARGAPPDTASAPCALAPLALVATWLPALLI